MPDTPSPSPSNLPVAVPLDRAALERVLSRAAELQAQMAEPSEGMTETQLEALGAEVGISKEHVRQAIAEERTRVAVVPDRGFIGSWFGPAVTSASRVVRGKADQILQQLDHWMQSEEGLRPRRRFVDRLTWEARRDLLSSVQAGLNIKGRAYSLMSATEVGATVVSVDGDRAIVRLDADVSDSRRRWSGWTMVAGGGMLASAGGLVAFTTLVPGASLLVGSVVAGVWSLVGVAMTGGLAAAQRRRTERAQLALEQILDRLERGEMSIPSRGGQALLDLLSPMRR